MQFDAVVIGAGAVGLACARALSQKGFATLVVERHGKNGQETSSRNSCVIHAGMYYPEGSLKAQLCFRSNQLLYEYCSARNIAHRKIGKFIVAVNREEEPQLQNIYERGLRNGVEGMAYVSGKEVQKDNPEILCTSAIYSGQTGIIDPHEFMDALQQDAEAAGCIFLFGHNLIAVEPTGERYQLVLQTRQERVAVASAIVINAAGLDSDKVAELAKIDLMHVGYRLHYCRGHYFKLHPRRSRNLKNLIYPVPPKEMAGLGIHITVDLAGDARLGPDTEYLTERIQDYRVDEALRKKFYQAARWYLPSLQEDELSADYAGIRPKLQGPNDKYRDFVIQEESERGLKNWVNLIGIESPGLTCALGIANHVCTLLRLNN